MDKRLYILAGLLVLGGLGYYLSKPSCKPASEQDVRSAQVACWQNYDKSNFKEKLCNALKGTQECELFRETDGDAVEAFIVKEIQPCVDQSLKASNLCKPESK